MANHLIACENEKPLGRWGGCCAGEGGDGSGCAFGNSGRSTTLAKEMWRCAGGLASAGGAGGGGGADWAAGAGGGADAKEAAGEATDAKEVVGETDAKGVADLGAFGAAGGGTGGTGGAEVSAETSKAGRSSDGAVEMKAV